MYSMSNCVRNLARRLSIPVGLRADKEYPTTMATDDLHAHRNQL